MGIDYITKFYLTTKLKFNFKINFFDNLRKLFLLLFGKMLKCMYKSKWVNQQNLIFISPKFNFIEKVSYGLYMITKIFKDEVNTIVKVMMKWQIYRCLIDICLNSQDDYLKLFNYFLEDDDN